MKNKMKLSMYSVLLIGSLVGTGGLTANASSNEIHNLVAQQAASSFKDVSTDSYAFDAIVWGKDRGLISGYTGSDGKPNGKFGPNDNVTEAQFVKMVSVYLGLKDNAGNITKNKNNGTQWSDTYYDAMAKHGVPLNGYFDNAIRNQPMKRGSVAQALAYLLGESTNLKDSINYLLATGVTSGQNPQYEGKDLYKFFGTTNNLTRGQVITFLYRMDSKNLNNLSSLSNMTASDSNNLNAKAKEGYSYVDVSLGGTKNTNNTNTGNNTGQYDNFFGNGTNTGNTGNTGGNNGNGNNTGNTTQVESKTKSEIIKEMESVLGSKNVELLKKNNVPAYDAKVGKDGTIQVTYLKRTNSEVFSFTVYSKNGVLGELGASYPVDVIKELYANILGIPKSKLTGTAKDTKIVHSKYKVYYSSDGIYSLVVK